MQIFISAALADILPPCNRTFMRSLTSLMQTRNELRVAKYESAEYFGYNFYERLYKGCKLLSFVYEYDNKATWLGSLFQLECKYGQQSGTDDCFCFRDLFNLLWYLIIDHLLQVCELWLWPSHSMSMLAASI